MAELDVEVGLGVDGRIGGAGHPVKDQGPEERDE